MKQKIIAVDFDDVIVDLIPTWLDMYNVDYDDQLKSEDITDWDISKFVKSECGKMIYEYLDLPNLYDDVNIVSGALDGIDKLREVGYRIVFVTSTNIAQNGQKLKWLQNNHFLPKERYSRDYVEATDKSLIRCNIIIDDKLENCDHPTAMGLLFDRPHNQNFDTAGYENIIRVYDWEDIVSFLLALKELTNE